MSHLNFAEAGIVGLLQGITELFPVSSLGHAVLIPPIVGGQWAQDLNVSRSESPYLAYIVGLLVATIPVGVAGLALEHTFRTVFSKPTLTASFLRVNGLILLGGERLRRRGAG